MADEDDYMSDIFIQNLVEQGSKLHTNRNVLRKRKIEKDKSDSDLKNKFKPKHVIEHEQREKGLSTSLTGDNLGFKLMQKTGYKMGDGLGKKSEGRSEPIPITLKVNRFGLGKESSDKAKLSVRKQLLQIVSEKKTKLERIQRNDFRARMSKKFLSQLVEKDLSKSQNACLQLDSAEEIAEPLYEFFWPSHSIPDNEEEEEEFVDDYSSEDKLSMLTSYLRQQYCYCIWCSNKFDDLDDMMNNCPGDTASAHED